VTFAKATRRNNKHTPAYLYKYTKDSTHAERVIYPKSQHNIHPLTVTFANTDGRNNQHAPAYLYKDAKD
jgi:hypothetical protein